MLNLSIDDIGLKVRVPEGWHEITINKWVELDGIMQEYKPDEDDTPDTVLTKQANIARHIFASLSGVTIDQVDKFATSDVMAVVDMALQEPEPKEISEFTFEGVTYELPKTTEGLAGRLNYGDGVEFGRYIEAKHMEAILSELQGGNIRKIPYLIAYLCNVKGEEWSSEIVQQTVAQLGELDVSTAVNCAFFLASLMSISLRRFTAYFSEVRQQTSLTTSSKSTHGKHYSTNLRKV